MLRPRHSPSAAAVALLVLVGLTAGCRSPRSTAPEPSSKTDTSQKGSITMNVIDPHVGIDELQCITTHFMASIHHGDPMEHKPIGSRYPVLLVKVGTLQDVVAQLACTSGETVDHAVIVHPGLTDQNAFDVLVQVVCLKYDNNTREYSYDPTDVGYTLDGTGQLVLSSSALADWNGLNGPGTRYRSQVVLQRGKGGAWEKFDGSYDVSSVVYAYEGGLQNLIAHNDLDPDDLLLVEPAAELIGKDYYASGHPKVDSYVQGMVWVPMGVRIDDQVNSGTPYKMKAADLGAPCPVNCPTKGFRFPHTGVDGCS